MKNNKRIFTRRELYDLVWSKPILKLAEEFGLSDRGLAKKCDRHRVPCPPRGYWAKLAAGKKVKQTIFVQVDDPVLDRIVIASSLNYLPEETLEILKKAKAERAERSKTKRVRVVPLATFGYIEKPHKAVVATARKLRKGKSTENGGVSAVGQNLCGIVVHRDRIERVISILDRLALKCEELEFSFTADGEHMAVSLGGDKISITLLERTKRVIHVPTKPELAAYEKKQRRSLGGGLSNLDFGWSKPWSEFDTVFTGHLAFVIGGWAYGLRKTWADGKTQSVESLFEGIIIGVQATLAYEKFQREEREEFQRKSAELQRRRLLATKREEREEGRVEFLNELTTKKVEADQLRSWLAGCLIGPAGKIDPNLSRMTQWAEKRLYEIDQFLAPASISLWLKQSELFPEKDELFDPEGDPPQQHSYY